MSAIFVFSEDGALSKQLLTPALELKKSLSQPVTVITVSEADAKELAALGADKVLVLKVPSGWTEGLSEPIYKLLSGAGPSVFVVGGTLRGKHVGAYVAAKLNAGMPVIVASGSFPVESVRYYPQLHIAAVIPKPFSRFAFLDTVKNVLSA